MLRDETLAPEIMEAAIEQAVAYLVDQPPEQLVIVAAANLVGLGMAS